MDYGRQIVNWCIYVMAAAVAAVILCANGYWGVAALIGVPFLWRAQIVSDDPDAELEAELRKLLARG